LESRFLKRGYDASKADLSLLKQSISINKHKQQKLEMFEGKKETITFEKVDNEISQNNL